MTRRATLVPQRLPKEPSRALVRRLTSLAAFACLARRADLSSTAFGAAGADKAKAQPPCK